MIIKNYGSFTQIQIGNFLHYKNGDGNDWNEMQMGRNGHTALVELGNQGELISSVHDVWAMVSIHTNKITNVDIDPSKLVPYERIIIGIDTDDIDSVKEDMIFEDGVLTDPPEPTIDEIRDSMVPLTSRQFWMAAASINIDKEVLVTLIKDNMNDTIDRKMMIAELETSTFYRNNVTVVELMELMEITPEQADDLWIWASQI